MIATIGTSRANPFNFDSATGKVGVWTKADSVTEFDDFGFGN